MPILAMNKNGQIYQTSSDRSDGLGFGAYPTPVHEGDLTLGSAFKKAQAKRRNDLLDSRREQAIMDQQDREHRAFQKQQLKLKHAEDVKEVNLLQNENVRRTLQKQALAMNGSGSGCSCEYKRPLTGNVMSSNGQMGRHGLSHTQKALHHHYTGRGANVSFGIEPVEQEQIISKAKAMELHRARGRRQEQVRKIHASQDQVATMGRKIHYPNQMLRPVKR